MDIVPIFLLLVLGACTGLLAGLLGIGGGMVMVPFMTVYLDYKGFGPDSIIKVAIATSLASILFIGFFMIWLGRYSWLKSSIVALSVNVVTFLLFEIWFKVPLPKGPIESLLGLA